MGNSRLRWEGWDVEWTRVFVVVWIAAWCVLYLTTELPYWLLAVILCLGPVVLIAGIAWRSRE